MMQRGQQRGECVVALLMEEFPHLENFLSHKDPFQLLIAIILSARCTDARVNQITPRLFAEAPDAFAMENLPLEIIEKIIRPVGFFRQKARAISQTAHILVQKWQGQVPLHFHDLESLPGVGHKTASVLIGQWTGKPTFPVDTHVYRLARRWKLSSGKTVETVERDLKKIFPQKLWFPLHQRMIAYGRAHCTARGCDGKRCKICRTLLCLENDGKSPSL
jgi:endonuclease-3